MTNPRYYKRKNSDKASFRCPNCLGSLTVIATRPKGSITKGTFAIKRRRLCSDCKGRFTTYEFLVLNANKVHECHFSIGGRGIYKPTPGNYHIF